MLTIITSLYRSEPHIRLYLKFLFKVLRYFRKRNFGYEVIIIANVPNIEEKIAIAKLTSIDRNIKCIEVEHETLYASWNRGIKQSKGNAITFWNVDDIRFAKAMVEGYDKIINGTDIVYFSFIILRRHKYYNFLPIPKVSFDIAQRFNRIRFRTGAFCGPFFMINRNLINKIGYFDEQFKIVGDMEFCVRAADADANFCKVNSLAGVHIKGGDTLSGNRSTRELQELENQIVYKKYGITHKYLPLTEFQKKLLKYYDDYKSLFRGE